MAKDFQCLAGIEQAAKNIVALINERPRSPTEPEIARAIASGLQSSAPAGDSAELDREVRQVVRAIYETEARLSALTEGTPAHDRQEAVLGDLWEKLAAVGAKLPMTPQSFAELLTIAEIAYYHWEKGLDGTLCSLREDHCPQPHWTARLIFATMSLGGRTHA